MSMISAQCDELRKTADELDEKAKAYAPTAHNALSPMLRGAADTICWLWKIARAHAAMLEGCGCDCCPYNEKCDPETMPMLDGCRMRDELRELGVAE